MRAPVAPVALRRPLTATTATAVLALIAACSSGSGGAGSNGGDGTDPGATGSNGGTGGAGGGASSGSGPVAGGSSGGASSDGASSGGASSSGGSSSGDVDAGPGPVLDPRFVGRDVNHVLVTGQSNATAAGAYPPVSMSQPYANLMFDVGVFTGAGCDFVGCSGYQNVQAFVPLVEGDHYFADVWDTVESPGAGLANQAARLARNVYLADKQGTDADHRVLVSNHARSGSTYWCLRKGTCYHDAKYTRPFDEAVWQMQRAKQLADAGALSYAVRAVAAVHGESDSDAMCSNDEPDYNAYWPGQCPAFYRPNGEYPLYGSDGTPNALASYADALLEWQRDLEAAAKQITGQAESVPLFVSQYSGWKDRPRSRLPALQLEAHVRSQGKVVLVGPTYMLEFHEDALHFTNHATRRLGEYFAKAYAETVLGGRPWQPLRPVAVARAGATITVRFHVPKPPLVLDTTQVKDPGAFGFEYADDSGAAAPAIASVAVTGPDTVTITLAAAPTGANGRVRYAMKALRGTYPGPVHGARGNLRDSDATPSEYGYRLENWAVHFDEPVR